MMFFVNSLPDICWIHILLALVWRSLLLCLLILLFQWHCSLPWKVSFYQLSKNSCHNTEWWNIMIKLWILYWFLFSGSILLSMLGISAGAYHSLYPITLLPPVILILFKVCVVRDQFCMHYRPIFSLVISCMPFSNSSFLLTCNLFLSSRLGVLNVNSTGRLLFSFFPILVLFSCGYCSCLCCHIKYSILGISSQLLMDLCKQYIYIFT